MTRKHILFFALGAALLPVRVFAAEISDSELQSAMEACREHPGSADVGNGFSRPGSNGFAKGYEVCNDILTRWKATERAKREQDAVDKKAAGEAAIKSVQQKLGK